MAENGVDTGNNQQTGNSNPEGKKPLDTFRSYQTTLNQPTVENIDPRLERAKKGVSEYSDFLKKNKKHRQVLSFDNLGQRLQAMFLRIRPATLLLPSEQKLIAGLKLPSRFKIATGSNEYWLYDETLAGEVLARFPQDFSDYTTGENIGSYMASLASATPKTGREQEVNHIRTGLLLGFPEKSVRQSDHSAD